MKPNKPSRPSLEASKRQKLLPFGPKGSEANISKPSAQSRLMECVVCLETIHASLLEGHINECLDRQAARDTAYRSDSGKTGSSEAMQGENGRKTGSSEAMQGENGRHDGSKGKAYARHGSHGSDENSERGFQTNRHNSHNNSSHHSGLGNSDRADPLPPLEHRLLSLPAPRAPSQSPSLPPAAGLLMALPALRAPKRSPCLPPAAGLHRLATVELDSALAWLKRAGAMKGGKRGEHLCLNDLTRAVKSLRHSHTPSTAQTTTFTTAATTAATTVTTAAATNTSTTTTATATAVTGNTASLAEPDRNEEKMALPAKGFTLALGDCGKCSLNVPRELQHLPGFISYLPAYLQTALGPATVAAVEASLQAHTHWDVHKFLINGEWKDGLRDSFIVQHQIGPEGSDEQKPENHRSYPWDHFPWLEELKRCAEELTGLTYDICLVHRYIAGKHLLGYHSDESTGEKYDECGQVVVSMSIGGTRNFDIRWITRKAYETHEATEKLQQQQQPPHPILRWKMQRGDVIVMFGGMQAGRGASGWKHAVPPPLSSEHVARPVPRYNLTFRRFSPGRRYYDPAAKYT
eukprot:g81242.t1